MMSRPGSYLLVAGVRYDVTEGHATVMERLEGHEPDDLVTLTDWNTGKALTVRRGSIELVREGGF